MDINEIKRHIEENEITFTNIFNSCENGYAILQLPFEIPYKFKQYSDLGQYPDRYDYKILFAEKCIDMPELTDVELNEILEGIFLKFNTDFRPTVEDNYYGTSLSVSDVIILKLNNKEYPYYVDGIGFKKIKNFNFNQTEKVKPALSDEEYNSLCERMADCANLGTEEGHIAADYILVEVLEKMGYKKLVELYLELDKWYA